ncbi:WD40-repeat-containing domain protein [Infundibulicybe gibba]|nr:WD40-repeat-containing domain protein [Infundibulicybe gibba]
MAEDSQPNERLLIRNRGHAVPAIRTVRGNFRKGPPRREPTFQRPPPYAPRQNGKTPLGFQSQSSHEVRAPQASGSAFCPRSTKFEQIMVELPHNCRRGVSRSYQNRCRFIKEQTQRIEGEPGVMVHSFNFRDHTMVFRCSRDSQIGERHTQPERPLERPKPPSLPISSISGVPRTRATEEVKLPQPPPAQIFDEVIVGHITEGPDTRPQSAVIVDDVAEVAGIPNLNILEPKPPEPGLRVFSSGNLTIPPWGFSSRDPVPPNAHSFNHLATDQPGDVILIDDSGDEFTPEHQTDSGFNIPGAYPTDARLRVGEIASVPLPIYDKPRRILFPPSTPGVINISMRGHINQLDISPLRHRRTLVSPESTEAIDDACMLAVGNDVFAVLGHVRDTEQISLFNLGNIRGRSVFSLDRPQSSRKSGVSALATMMQPHMFASGGHDHLVHVWDINPELSSASPKTLGIKHSSLVQSLLAIRDTSHKLVSASADCSVQIWDLASERAVNTFRTSNSIYHAHKTPSPFCTLLEVAHRELQFEIQDHRLVPQHPVQRFGYPISHFHGRFIKGDTMHDNFICGGRDGLVRLWDLRNNKAVAASALCSEGKIVQASFAPGHIAVCSEGNQISFLDYVALS